MVVQGQASDKPFTTLCGPAQHVGRWDEIVPWSELPDVHCSHYKMMIIQGSMPVELSEAVRPFILDFCGCVDGTPPKNPECHVSSSQDSRIVGELNAEVNILFFFDGSEGMEKLAKDQFFSAAECENEV